MISRFYLHVVVEFLHNISSVISRSVRKLFDLFNQSELVAFKRQTYKYCGFWSSGMRSFVIVRVVLNISK